MSTKQCMLLAVFAIVVLLSIVAQELYASQLAATLDPDAALLAYQRGFNQTQIIAALVFIGLPIFIYFFRSGKK